MMRVDYNTRDVVLYIARMLRCFRVSKLESIVFLAQHDVDVERRVVYEYRCGGRPLARARFYIWSHGPASDEVYDALESDDFDVVSGELGLKWCYGGPAPQLPQPVAARLNDVVAKYGGWKPWQLQLHVKKLLGLDIPERLSDYMGVWLYTYLRAEGFHLTAREVCIKP
jgi:uncharacterized phage-associated protein